MEDKNYDVPEDQGDDSCGGSEKEMAVALDIIDENGKCETHCNVKDIL